MSALQKTIVAAILTATLPVFCSAARAGLVGHWTLDESPASNGTTIADSSGLGHDGTLTVTGTPADRSAVGIAGGAIDFDGAGDRIAADLGSDLATGSSPFTVTAWINPDLINTSQKYVVSQGPGTGGQFFSMSFESAGGEARIRYRAYAGFLDFDASAITASSGWHQVAAVLPAGSTTLGDFDFYLDGQPMTRLPGGPTGTAVNLQLTDFHIGDSAAAPGTNVFAGLIDDVQYYDEPLGDRHIELLYASPGAVLTDLTTTISFGDFEFRTAEADGDSPANSSQTAGPLFVRERGNPAETSQRTQAFLEFDLSALDDREILDATLYLHENDKLNNVYSADLSIARVLDDWDAVGGTAPVFDGAVADEFVFGDNGPASAGPGVDIDHFIDVTEIVKLWQADPSGNFGFRLKIGPNFVAAAFDHTGALAPVLMITQVVPEPSALLLAALGLLGLGLCRRRRRTR